MTSTDKIFVSIANYRDSETPFTVDNLLAMAKFKDRLTIGVFSQIDRQTDKHCLAPSLPQVVQQIVDYKDSRGVCWARSYLLSKIRKNEKYVLQIDSHTRMIQDWDEVLINMLDQCDPKGVLTHYPAGYQPFSGMDEPNRYLRLGIKSLDAHGIPILGGHPEPIANAPAIPERAAFYSGNFSFTYAKAYDDVPYDPHIYFLGEETTMAVRLYTHGYNLYTPNQYVAWHQFNIDKFQPDKKPRPLHWTDNKWGHLEQASRKRIQYLLKIKKDINPGELLDISKYGLGKERSLNQYQEFAGVYFKSGHMDSRARTGKYGRT